VPLAAAMGSPGGRKYPPGVQDVGFSLLRGEAYALLHCCTSMLWLPVMPAGMHMLGIARPFAAVDLAAYMTCRLNSFRLYRASRLTVQLCAACSSMVTPSPHAAGPATARACCLMACSAQTHFDRA
jgi:hypothetical protein